MPNCPAHAGAMAAYTGVSLRSAWMHWKIWDLSAMAPKGQLARHMPQLTHLS